MEVDRAAGLVRVIAGAAPPEVDVTAPVVFAGGPLDARFDVLDGEVTGLSSEASYDRAMRSAKGTSSIMRRSKTDMATRRESGSKVMSLGDEAAIVAEP